MLSVSIIIPLYNKVAYIKDTIQSVVSQTDKNWEMLIVDNGSTDGSWEKVKEIKDQRIRLLQSPKQGPGAARNYGLIHASGEWILFLDADDLLESDYLEQQLSAIRKKPDAEIIVGYWQEFTDENPTVKILKQPAGMGQPIEVLRDSTIAFAPWAVHAALVKCSALSSGYYWPEEMDGYLGEDIAFWFRLVSNYTVVYGESRGALYRIQTPLCRTQNLNPEKWFEGIHAAIKFNHQYLKNESRSYTPRQCENLMRVYSGIYLLAHQRKSVEVEVQALSAASKWLKQYFRVAQKPKTSMLIRRLLGLKLFLSLFKSKDLAGNISNI